jgi:hypothetical protein
MDIHQEPELRRGLARRFADKLVRRGANRLSTLTAHIALDAYAMELQRKGWLTPEQAAALEAVWAEMASEPGDRENQLEHAVRLLGTRLDELEDLFTLEDLKRLGGHWGDIDASVIPNPDWID